MQAAILGVPLPSCKFKKKKRKGHCHINSCSLAVNFWIFYISARHPPTSPFLSFTHSVSLGTWIHRLTFTSKLPIFSRPIHKQSWARTSLWKSVLWVCWFAKGHSSSIGYTYPLPGRSRRRRWRRRRDRRGPPSRQTVMRKKCNGEHLAITILVGYGMLAPILSGKTPAQHSSNENLAGLLADWLSHQGPLPKVPLPCIKVNLL